MKFFFGKNINSTMQSPPLRTLREQTFENIMEKGENAGNQHFLLFPQCFLSFSNRISISYFNLFCRLQFNIAFNLDHAVLKFCRLVKR